MPPISNNTVQYLLKGISVLKVLDTTSKCDSNLSSYQIWCSHNDVNWYWDMTTWPLVNIYRHYGGAYCRPFQSRGW